MRTLILTSALISSSFVSAPVVLADDHQTLNLFGTLRPILRHSDDGDDNTLDVQDAISRVGVKGSTQISPNLTAYFKGAWRVRIEDQGKLDQSRAAYMGLKGNWGSLSIGTQRPPQYTLIAEHVDIYNHSGSPYGYDFAASDEGFGGAFVVDNSVVYSASAAGLTFMAMSRSDGSDGEDQSDTINAGLGYKTGPFYIAGTYLRDSTANSTNADLIDSENTTYAVASSLELGDIYLAVAYQDITKDPEASDEDQDQSSIDAVLAYSLPSNYKVKLGYYDYDDDDDTANSQSVSGFSATLERQVASNVRLHVEYLSIDPEEGDSGNQINLGMRYDFDVSLIK